MTQLNSVADALLLRIQDKSCLVGVVGLGYVGLPLAVEFAQAGFRVVGIDTNRAVVKAVGSGRSHIDDVPSSTLAVLVRKRMLRAQQGYAGCGKCDAIIICVPTPLRKTRDPDISYIVKALDELSPQPGSRTHAHYS